MPAGYWCPVLHAHLPYVRHPEHARFLEEDWFFEALTETYVPLLRVMDGLARDGVEFRLTMTLSPPLVSMMTDELLIGRYRGYLDDLVELARREVRRTRRGDPAFGELARFYLAEFEETRRYFRETWRSRILDAFRRHRDAGRLEILACAATHGFLPLMDPVPQAVRAQVQVGVQHYRRHLGRDPAGIWLPECGYFPGHEVFLKEAGLRFSFLEAHGLVDAHPRPRFGVHAPVVSPGGIVFFGRDMESSRQVWSAESGYPGDPDYREFYRDVGWDLPLDSLADFLPDGQRKNLGIKYHRVTGRGVDLGAKAPYVRARALEKAAAHAADFVSNRSKQVAHLAARMDRPPVVVSPYDAELFGHWWYEGPQFLDFVLRRLDHERDAVKTITPSEYLALGGDIEVCQPPLSTWGAQGYAEVWLNGANDWIYPHLDMAAERMVELARRYEAPGPLQRRALDQAARELLLAQSSDWAFIMKTNTMVEYAIKRTRDHVARFDYLYRSLTGRCALEEPILREFEERDNIFPEIDFRVYR
jgi:1,4-alpha-glucan branching enzyme